MSTVFGITKLKVDKGGSTSVFSVSGLCFGIATLFQIIARLMTLHVLFSIDLSRIGYFMFILVHFLFEFWIKMYELTKAKPEPDLCILLDVLTSSLCGILVYYGLDTKSRSKHTFEPCSLHFVACIFEHCIFAIDSD